MADELNRLKELCVREPEIRRMVAIICDKEGAHSTAHLLDINSGAFDELLEAAESMYSQLGDE